MKLFQKSSHILMVIATTWMISSSGLVEAAPPTTLDLVSEDPGSNVVAGTSTLIRAENLIKGFVEVNNIDPGVYTIWYIVFGHGDPVGAHASLGGSFVTEYGITPNDKPLKIALDGKSRGDMAPRCDGFQIPDLSNLDGDVEIEIVSHGIPDNWDDVPESWLTTYWNGQDPVCRNDCSVPFEGWCTAVFTSLHAGTP